MDVAEPPAAADADASQLRRVLGPIDATCVVVGAIVGVGIFFTPSRVATLAGSGNMTLLAWAVGGVIALCGGLTFAELGARYPRAGGQYDIIRDAYGPLPAFVYVFCNATAIQAGAIAVIALVCAKYAAIAVSGGELTTAWAIRLATLLIVGVTVANIGGVRWGAGIQNLTVAAKLGTLVAVTLLAFVIGPAATTQSAAIESPSTSGALIPLCASLVPILFAYGGWQQGLWMAGEVREPRRNLPRAIVGGVLIVVAVYVLLNWALLHLLGYDGLAHSGAPASDAVARAWPATGRRATAAAIAISAFGVLNAQLLSGPRLIFRMAQDGRFFSFFAWVNSTRGTPIPAILLLGGLGLAILFFAAGLSSDTGKAIDRLTNGVVFVDGVFFVLTGLSLFVLRGRDVTDPATRHAAGICRGYPLTPALFVLGESGVIAGAYADPGVRAAAYIGLIWIAAAAILFVVGFSGRSPMHRREDESRTGWR